MHTARTAGENLGISTHPPRFSPLAIRLVVIAACLTAVVLTLATLSVYTSRTQYYIRADITARNVSAILAETVSGHLARIDAALRVIIDQAERDGWPETRGPVLDDTLALAKARVPHALAFRVAGPDGVIHGGVGESQPAGEVSIADRDYFLTLRDTPNAGLVISQPIRGRVSNEWVIILARRISDAQGGFAGIAYGSMAVKQISALFTAVALQPDDAIALRDAGHLGAVARYPETVDGAPVVGNPAVSSELKHLTTVQPDKGSYIATAPLDGIERVLAYHKVGPYPYYLLVGISTGNLMSQWLNDTVKVVALTLAFVVISVFGCWWMVVSLRARQELENRLRLIEFAINHAAEAVLLLDHDGGVVYGNAAATELFQRNDEALRRCPVWALAAGITRDDWAQRWRQLSRGEPLTARTDIVRPDGTVTPVVMTANYLSFGTGEFAVSIIRDIGEQLRHDQEMEQALRMSRQLGEALGRKNDELARFAEILAHHMKEPVRHQHIFAQRLARLLPPPLAPDVDDAIDCIVDGATRHLALLRDAERYLSLDQTSAAAPPTPAGIGLDRALRRLADRIRSRGASLHAEPLPELPIDSGALADVFAALIDNAITYHRPDLPPEVEIAAETRGQETVVTITDNGIGIPPEFTSRVFRVFDRLQQRPELPGTGIGLALARKIIDSAGGRIWIEQPDAPGTRVCLGFTAR
jgi:PAS domain S-box-containing protein